MARGTAQAAQAEQLSLFDAMRAPPIIRPVDPDGHVVQGRACHLFALWDQRTIVRQCQIEVHPTPDGLWMWSTNYNVGYGGAGYKVGEKWGKFAATDEDALRFAVEELRFRLAEYRVNEKSETKIIHKILAWASALTMADAQ